ncbi:addiction module toxin RelE, partial [Salmonella enterica subsp. enterica serovar Derby]
MYHLVLYFRLQDVNLMRIFKTRWFNREAKSHTIKDDELSEAINAVLQGKADNLG